MNESSNQIHSAVPVIGTSDINGSLLYYTTVLGFSPDFQYGDPVTYAGVKSGEAELYFTADPRSASIVKDYDLNPEIFIWINDAETLYQQHVRNGAEIVEPIADRPWDARQYVIKDINGYYLKFAQPL